MATKQPDKDSVSSAVHPRSLLRAWYRSRLLIVELVLTVFVLGREFYTPLSEQYFYHKFGSVILRNTSFQFPNGSFCVSSDLIDNSTGDNNSYKTVEAQSNHLVAFGQAASTVPSVIATIILGPVTNRYGRRIGMLLPIIGNTLQAVLSIFIVVFDLSPYYFILGSFIGGVFGSFTGFLAASFSYVADVSSPRWRSLRIGIMEAALAFGGSVGHFTGGLWLKNIDCNFVPPLAFFAGSNLLIGLYVIFVIPESLSREERKRLCQANPRGLSAYLQGFKLYLGKLSLRSTWKLYVSTIIVNVMLFNGHGAMLVDVYFLKAVPFDFNPLQIGIYQGERSASQGLANIFVMGILVALRVGDVWIMIIAVLVHCSCNTLVGFATKTWQLYAIASVKGIEGISWSGARGLMSKLVGPEQQGALFSIIASVESLAATMSGVVWPLIFPLTLQHNLKPGMTYIFMGALGSLLLLPLTSLLFLKKESAAVKRDAPQSGQIQYRDKPNSSERSPLLN